MKVGITGANGFIGRALATRLAGAGHRVVPLVRAGSGRPGVAWDPASDAVLPELDALDALIHLAGAPIADRRWTARRRTLLRRSRVDATRNLLTSLSRLAQPPQIILAASAIGYYGDRGAEPLTESSPPGNGFLPTLCRDWEEAAVSAAPPGARVVRMRFGMVLEADGGVLARLRPVYRLGLGGPLGDGRATISWIDRTDACAAMQRLLEDPTIAGPVNLTAPNPVTQRTFAKALGRALHRPAILPVPRLALRLVFGAMADEALLAGASVQPARLQAAGFRFLYPDLDRCLGRIFAAP